MGGEGKKELPFSIESRAYKYCFQNYFPSPCVREIVAAVKIGVHQ